MLRLRKSLPALIWATQWAEKHDVDCGDDYDDGDGGGGDDDDDGDSEDHNDSRMPALQLIAHGSTSGGQVTWRN